MPTSFSTAVNMYWYWVGRPVDVLTRSTLRLLPVSSIPAIDQRAEFRATSVTGRLAGRVTRILLDLGLDICHASACLMLELGRGNNCALFVHTLPKHAATVNNLTKWLTQLALMTFQNEPLVLQAA